MFTYWYAYLLKLDCFWKVGWSYLCYPPVTKAAQQSARRAAAAAQESQTAQVASAAQNATWRCFEGIIPRCTTIHVCMIIHIYFCSRWLNSLYLHVYIYINIHVFWSWFTYSMRLYIHSRWFNFSSWGKQVLMGNLHLFGGDVQKTLPLKGAWKNDGFIVSSTYFLLMVFFTGDMNSKQPCFVFGVEIWWFYDLDVLIGVFVVFV